MNMPSVKLNSSQIVYWFNAMRNLPEKERTRALDAVWAGQIDSKAWLINTLNQHVTDPANVYIFGGWVGILASMMFHAASFEIKKIRSIDLDPWCEPIADTVCQPQHIDEWRFKALTANMLDYMYDWDIYPDVVVNTSTEHVDQATYDAWYDRVPSGTLLVAQGNDFFDCPEHQRCTANLTEFKRLNHVSKPMFQGSLPHDLYTRYMCVWRK